jgi:hypothetical protein
LHTRQKTHRFSGVASRGTYASTRSSMETLYRKRNLPHSSGSVLRLI